MCDNYPIFTFTFLAFSSSRLYSFTTSFRTNTPFGPVFPIINILIFNTFLQFIVIVLTVLTHILFVFLSFFHKLIKTFSLHILACFSPLEQTVLLQKRSRIWKPIPQDAEHVSQEPHDSTMQSYKLHLKLLIFGKIFIFSIRPCWTINLKGLEWIRNIFFAKFNFRAIASTRCGSNTWPFSSSLAFTTRCAAFRPFSPLSIFSSWTFQWMRFTWSWLLLRSSTRILNFLLLVSNNRKIQTKLWK